jgi:hypothetical protein
MLSCALLMTRVASGAALDYIANAKPVDGKQSTQFATGQNCASSGWCSA